MAKGAKKKTKWVSLSLANANTKTSSVATGSDSEQTQSHQPPHGDGYRNKMVIGMAAKLASDLTAGVVTAAKQNESTTPDQSGNRTDTSTGSDGQSERRPVTAGTYNRRRPPPYRSSWNGSGATTTPNGRSSHYNRTGQYGNGGGGGYYGTGRKSHYDSHYARRQQAANTTTRTTSGEAGGGDGGATTINDDEYTRITTPRQDVLFKKGYLSRPKPSVATASTSNTTSSSIAGTTSEGSDGGNGGSNSISTTESITSEYGGSYAADGSQLFDYSFPCIPCGYFTENGVLVMNGFAVDNNGFSYFNGGQTYIYPPNFGNCQQSPTATGPEDQPTDGTMPYPPGNDETGANDFEPSPTNLPNEPVLEHVSELSGAFVESLATVDEETGHMYAPDGDVAALEQQVPVEDPAQVVANGEQGVEQEVVGDTTVAPPLGQVVQDFSENGYFQYTNGYDFAQFYSSLCYPGWLMDQCRMYDDAGLPLYCGGEYALSGEEVYGQQSSFKKRKKRFRTFEEMPTGNGTSYDAVVDATSSLVEQSSTDSDATACVPDNLVPNGDVTHHPHQLNAEVQEFQPSVAVVNPLPDVTTAEKVTDASAIKSNAQAAPKTRPSARTPKVPKTPPKVMPAVPAVSNTASVDSSSLQPPLAPSTTKSPASKTNRKKDLIESTLAFAAQNIDLTRPKASSSTESHDSELFWTTIDRNGRKKREAVVSADQERSAGEAVQEFTVETARPAAAPVQAKEILIPESPESATAATPIVSPDVGTGKKEQQSKSKKKTQKHKRHQLRKTVGGHNRQPLEGFQLIEPEFPSAAASGHRRGKSCDKAGRLEAAAAVAEQPATEIHLSSPAPIREQILAPSEETHEKVPDEKLNCDSQCNGDAKVQASVELVVVVETEEVVAQSVVLPTQSLSPAVDVKTIVNETETDAHRESLNKSQGEDGENEVVQQKAVKLLETSPDIERAVQNGIESVTVSDVEEDLVRHDVKWEVEQMPVGETAPESGTFVPTEVLLPATKVQLSAETDVLTSAAKQLTLSIETDASLREKAADELIMTDTTDDGIGSEGTDDVTRTTTATKRGSVAGVGYTESIDSGLQSPAPCGGVASPEASASMVSSIDSQPAIDGAHGAESSQKVLTQVVSTWLMQTLELLEPEEVFILPSNPLYRQRFQRLHPLRRRGRASVTSESEAEEYDEYDLEGEDTDSDYVSDGQGGRVDRTLHTEDDAANATGGDGTTQPSQVTKATARLDDGKRHEVAHSVSSERAVPREVAGSKRCTIM